MDELIQQALGAADRAVREVAPRALDAAGMVAEAESLRSLAAIADVPTARSARIVAETIASTIRGNTEKRAAWGKVDDAEKAASDVAHMVRYATSGNAQGAEMRAMAVIKRVAGMGV